MRRGGPSMRDRSNVRFGRSVTGVGLAMVMIVALSVELGLGRASAAPATPATVTIMHGLPGFTADVYVNEKLTLDGFKPKDATPALSLPAGRYDIAIRNVGESADTKPALQASVKLTG